MTTYTLFRREITDLRRSRLLVALVGCFAALLAVAALAYPPDDPVDLTSLLGGELNGLAVPTVGILLGAFALVDEVETGRLGVLLGVPVTRRDVFVGTVLGRAVLLVGAVAVGFLVAGAVLWVRPTALDPVALARVACATAGLGLAFLGIAVGWSAFAADRMRALGASFAALLSFGAPWELFVVAPASLLARGSVQLSSSLEPAIATDPAWYSLLYWGSPTNAFRAAISVSEPVVWMPVTVLVFWTVVPATVGYWRFRSRDIA
jgi:ABC-2 type transport system permease protein